MNVYDQSLSITAALLPSLQAQYKMERVHSAGVTAARAHFTVDLPQHSLSFVTKLQVRTYLITALCTSISIHNIDASTGAYWFC